MRVRLILAFLLMGLTFTVTQGLVIRALLVAFGGNELLIGMVLGIWLLVEAVGSALAGWLAARVRFQAWSFAVLQAALALLLPVTVIVGVLAHAFTGALPGEGVGFGPALGVVFLLLTPVGLVDGAMFAVGCVAGTRLARRESFSTGVVYALEALGGIGGGVALTYLVIPLSQPLRAALVLSALNLLSALALIHRPRDARSAFGVGVGGLLLLALAGGLITPAPDILLEAVVAAQWTGHQVVAQDDSVYGQVTVTLRGPEYTFFVDGLPLLTTPNPDTARVEELVHLPLLFGPTPRRVLVLSGGMGGVLHEVLKYPVASVDYAELDPLLVEEVRRFPTPLTAAELGDPRVQVHPQDGRLLVHDLVARGAGVSRYDLILVNLPYPTTLQINRFFTVEFYRAARTLLADEGVLVVPLPGSETYLGPELTDLHNLTRRTLGEAFPHVRAVPGETVLWLASPSPGILSSDADPLVTRWESTGLDARLVNTPYIRYKLDGARAAWFQETLARGRAVALNRDLHPVGVSCGLGYWNALFSPDLAGSFQALSGLDLLSLVAVVAVALGVFWAGGVWVPALRRATVPLVVGIAGFGGMAADVIVILVYQTLQGHVYHQIGLLVAAFMAGLAAGGLVMGRALTRGRGSQRWLLVLEAGGLGFWLVCPLLFLGLVNVGATGIVLPVLLAVNAGAGALVGAGFPLANRLVAGEGSRAAGFLYAADLTGACVGAVLVGVVLVPALGVVETCLLVAAFKAGGLLLVATRVPRGL